MFENDGGGVPIGRRSRLWRLQFAEGLPVKLPVAIRTRKSRQHAGSNAAAKKRRNPIAR